VKRKKIENTDSNEDKIITALVVSKEFLSQARTIIDVELIPSPHFKQIAKWCLHYFEKYNKAPGENIVNIYNRWSDKGKARDEDMEAVSDVLESLSGKYEQDESLNVPYLTDLASSLFNTRRMSKLAEEVSHLLEEGEEKSAQELITGFRAVAGVHNLGVKPLAEKDFWERTYAASQEPLITWGNKDADYFFGEAFCRDSLVGILAPEKRGKTQWCIEFAMRAVAQRRKVVLFEVGDMSEAQIGKRIGSRLSSRPQSKKHLGTIKVPKKIKIIDKNIKVRYRKIKCDKIASKASSYKANKKFNRAHGISPENFRLSIQPNSSVNVADLVSMLDQWELEDGFIPDVIIIDYPDILAPEPNTSNLHRRDQTDVTWKALRSLSQAKHCLVIAPTQADAASYNQEVLTQSNFSEDKRKGAHVTGLLGLNQNPLEKDLGVMRLNWIYLREGTQSLNTFLYVGQCYTLSKAFCCATL